MSHNRAVRERRQRTQRRKEWVVVTDQPAFVEYLCGQGIIPSAADRMHPDPCVRVMHFPGVEDIRGRTVVGRLPIRMAAEAALVIDVPLHVKKHKGKKLSLETVRRVAGTPTAYQVVKIGTWEQT